MSSAAPRTILLEWELGAGRGHLARLVPIIKALRSDGHNVIAAMRDLRAAREIFAEVGKRDGPGSFMLGQASIFVHTALKTTPKFSLAEILAHIGFADPELVRPVVNAWSQLLARFKPDSVLLDSAPSLALAAQGRVKTVAVGNGWSIPPSADAVPPLPLDRYDATSAQEAEQRICDSVNTLDFTSEPLTRFSDLLRGGENFVCTPAELDPYFEHRSDPLYWPPELPVTISEVGHSDGTPLVYLPEDHAAIGTLDGALDSLDIQAAGYFRGAQMEMQAISTSSIPLDLSARLPTAQFVVHHGGLGIASYALAFNVPQLILPVDTEKAVTALALVRHGKGTVLRPNTEKLLIEKTVAEIISRPRPKNFKNPPEIEAAGTTQSICGAMTEITASRSIPSNFIDERKRQP